MTRQMTWLQIWAWRSADVHESDFENSLLFSTGNNDKKDKSSDYWNEARMDDSRQ